MGYLHAIKIEAIGDVSKTATDGLYRYAYSASYLDNAAAADPDELYRTSLLQWPNELGSSIDFRTGAASSSSQRYKLRADSAGAMWQQLLRYTHTEVAELIDELPTAGAAATIIKVNTAGLSGAYFISRECINIDVTTQATIAGGFSYTCARAQLGTRLQHHLAGALDDKYLFGTCHVLAGRRVSLLRVEQASASAYAEQTIWSGVLRNIVTPDSGLTVELQADSALQLVQGQQILRNRFEGTCFIASDRAVDPLQIFHVGPNVAPAGGAGLSSSRRALFRVGDHLVQGDYSQLIARDGSNFQLTINVSPPATFAGLPLPQDLSQLAGAPIREVYTTRADAPSNAIAPGDQTLPLAQHIGKLVLQLLTTTSNGNTAGPNGDYDTGIDALAGNVPSSLVDSDQILQWGSQIGISQTDLYIGLDEQPQALGALLQQLLAPMMSVMVQFKTGQIGVVRLEDLAPYGDTNTITQQQVLDVGIMHDSALMDAVDQVALVYAKMPGIEQPKVTARNALVLRRQPSGFSNSLDLAADGVADLDIATLLVQALVARFHDPIPIINITTSARSDFDLGDVVKVTHEYIFTATGARNVTALNCLVIGRQESFTDEQHSIAYTLMMVGLIHPRDSYIAPSATVAAAINSTTFTVNSTTFCTSTASADDPFVSDVDGFAVADVIEFVDQFGTPTGASAVTIATIVGNQITATGAITPAPVAGDVIRPAAYASCASSQQDAWVYVANSSNLLGTDLPKTYRG